MLKRTMTYTDYNGNERTEDFYFNLTKAELFDMQMGVSGGLKEMLERLIAAQDAPAIIKTVKEIVLKAYGVKSPDGKYFEKSEKISTAFSQTEAFSQLYMELATDADAAAKFVNGIIPAEMSKQLDAPANN